jgi:hypothetical protein
MSNRQLLATYTNGVFRPIDSESLGLTEGQQVMLEVEAIDRATYILGLARDIYAGLSDEEINEIEQASRHRPLFSLPLSTVGD